VNVSDQRPPASNAWSLETSLIHAGERNPPPEAIPSATPIYTATTYIYPDLAGLDQAFESGTGYLYTRFGNPTVAALEAAVAAAEAARGAVAYGSGMAALHAALLAATTPRGETAPQPRCILAARDLYGSTTVLLNELFAARGCEVVYADLGCLEAAGQALATHKPQAVLIEQISNPLLHVVDVAGLAALCKPVGARLIVDSTIATPVLHQPLRAGADLVVHSATKYLAGHGDTAGGVVAARTGMVHTSLVRQSRLLGASLGPFEAQQILRGMKTLALRMERQCANAAAIAGFLTGHPAIERVYFPGLPTHPQHTLAAIQFAGRFGGMVSFVLQGERSDLERFVERLQLFVPATTLGDLYSLVTVPAISSHRELTPDERAARGISDMLVRLSLGIEATADLISDLAQALP
jgi:cystathionine gamma-synthase